MARQVVVYSHGFGVRKDDRGLFSDIAVALPEFEHVMFDYGEWDEERKELSVSSLTDQAKRLSRAIEKTKFKYTGSTIDLVCHSQGCVVAALLKPRGTHKIIFTGPPAHLSVDDMVQLFANRPGSQVHLNGVSRLKRADFSIINVPPEYWKSIENIDPVSLYNELSESSPLTVINATEDEIIGSKDFSKLSPNIKVIEISTGHNFEGEGREQLIEAITGELGHV